MADVLAEHRAAERARGTAPASIARPSRSVLNAAELANLDRRLLDYGVFSLEGLPPDQRAFLESLGALPGRAPAGWEEAMGVAPTAAPRPAGGPDEFYAGIGDELVPAAAGPASRPFGELAREFFRSNLGAAGLPGDVRGMAHQETFEAIAGELKRIEGIKGRIDKVKAMQALDARYGADAVKKAFTTINQVGPAQATAEPRPPAAAAPAAPAAPAVPREPPFNITDEGIAASGRKLPEVQARVVDAIRLKYGLGTVPDHLRAPMPGAAPAPGATTVARSTPTPATEVGPTGPAKTAAGIEAGFKAMGEGAKAAGNETLLKNIARDGSMTFAKPAGRAMIEARPDLYNFTTNPDGSISVIGARHHATGEWTGIPRVAATAEIPAPVASPESPPISQPSPIASPAARARKVAAATSAAPPPLPAAVPELPPPPQAPNVPGPPTQVVAPAPSPSPLPEFRPMDRPGAMAPASGAAPEFRTNAGDKVLSPAQMEARIAQASKVGAVGYTEAEQAAMEARASGRMASPTAEAGPARANPVPARPPAPPGPFTLTGPRHDPLDALRMGLKNNTIPQTAGRAPVGGPLEPGEMAPLEAGEMAPLEARLRDEFGLRSIPKAPPSGAGQVERIRPGPSSPGRGFSIVPPQRALPAPPYEPNFRIVPDGTSPNAAGQVEAIRPVAPAPGALPGPGPRPALAGPPPRPFQTGPVARASAPARPASPYAGANVVGGRPARPTTAPTGVPPPSTGGVAGVTPGAATGAGAGPAAGAVAGAAAKPGLIRGAFGAAGRGIYNAAGYVPGGQPALKGYGTISPYLPAAAILSDPYGTAEGTGAFAHNAARVLQGDVNPLARQVGGFVGGVALAPIQAVAGMAKGDFNPAARMTLLPQVAGGALKLVNGVGGVLNQAAREGWRPAAASALGQLAVHAGGLHDAQQAGFDRARAAYEAAHPGPEMAQATRNAERSLAAMASNPANAPGNAAAATPAGTGEVVVPGLGRMTDAGARALADGTITPDPRGLPGRPPEVPAAPAAPAPPGDLAAVLARIADRVAAPLPVAQSRSSAFEIHPGFHAGRMTAMDSGGPPMVPNGPVPDTLSPMIAAGAQADAVANQAQLGQRRTLADFATGAVNAQANMVGAQAEKQKAANQEAIFKDKSKLKIYLIAQGMSPQAAEAAVNQGGPPPPVNQQTLGGLLSPGGSHAHMAGLLVPKETPTPYHAAEFGLRTGADRDPYSFQVWSEAMRRRFSDEEIQKALQPGMIEREMGESPGAKQARALLSRHFAGQSR